MLEKLAGANAFVMGLGVQRDWYSYHPLLRELLAHRLGLEHPRLVPELHRRAAEWMADNGEPIEAVRQSTLAGDLEEAGRRLLAVIPLILSVQRPVLAAAIEPLALTAAQRPTLSSLLASAAVHYYRLDVGPMLQDAREAREFLDEAPEDVRTPAEAVILLFEMAAARSQWRSGRGAPAVEQCARAAGSFVPALGSGRPALPGRRGRERRRRADLGRQLRRVRTTVGGVRAGGPRTGTCAGQPQCDRAPCAAGCAAGPFPPGGPPSGRVTAASSSAGVGTRSHRPSEPS